MASMGITAVLAISFVLAGCVYKPTIREVPSDQLAIPPAALGESSTRTQMGTPAVLDLYGETRRSCGYENTFPHPSVAYETCNLRDAHYPMHCECLSRDCLRPMGQACRSWSLQPNVTLLPVLPPVIKAPVCHIQVRHSRPHPVRRPVLVRRPTLLRKPRCAAIHYKPALPHSSPVVLERYVPAPVDRCGCAVAHRGRAYLTSADMTFITHGYGKLASSGIWVQVVNRTFTATLVRATNWQREELQSFNSRYTYAPQSVHTFALPIERSVFGYGFFATQRDRAHYLEKIPGRDQHIWFKSDCRHLLFQVGIMARSAMLGTTGNTFGFDGRTVWSGYGGHNRWDFTAILTLHFSDGSRIIYERPFVMLNSVNGKLVLTRFR